MGNVEAKALTRSSCLNTTAIRQTYWEYLTYKKNFTFDRAAFGLLFDSERVPFAIVDSLFDALDDDHTESLPFADVVLPVVCSAADLDVESKLDMVFSALDERSEDDIPFNDMVSRLTRMVERTVRRMRGHELVSGKTQYVERRCTACREMPINVVYECDDCQRGTAMWLPVTVFLCKNCLSWEGYGCTRDMHHTKAHSIRRTRGAPNPHSITHTGVGCSACGTAPIVGTRYTCMVCPDYVELCDSCYQDGETPLGHSNDHKIRKVDRALSLEEEVQNFLRFILLQWETNSAVVAVDGTAAAPRPRGFSRSDFIAWGKTNVVTALMRGFNVAHAALCRDPEGAERTVEDVPHKKPVE